MGVLRRVVLAAVLLSGAATAIGLARMDHVAQQRDFQMVAELPAAAPSHGEFAQERALGNDRLGRTCIEDRCLAHIRTDSGTQSFGPEFDQNARVRLLQSSSRKALLLEANGTALAIMDDEPSAWDWRHPTILDTGAFLQAVPTLLASATLGLFAALLFLGLRARVAQRLAVVAAAKDGRIEDGWLRVSDAVPPLRVGAIDNGPVLVCYTANAAAPYRGDERDGHFELLDGDRQDNETPLLRRARRFDVAALTFASCTSAPLIAALVAATWL